MQRPKLLQNCHFRSKNKIAINMQKTTPKEQKNCSKQLFKKWDHFCSTQKAAPENS